MTEPTELTASDRLVHELTVATDASIGVICIRCPETEVYRVVDDLYALAMSQKTNFRLHSSELGWQEFARIDPEDTRCAPFDPLEPMNSDKATADILKAFEKLYGSKEGTGLPDDGFFVMLDLHYSFGEMATQTRIRKQAQRSLNNGQRLFLVVPHSAEIPEAIAPLMHIIQFDYPTLQELSDTLDDVLSALDDEDKPSIDDNQRAAIIANGLGMTTNAFETAVAVSITEYSAAHETLEDFSAEDIMSSIRGYKTQMLRKTNVLELQPTVPEEEIGGLDLFKSWMHQRKMTYSDKAKENHVTPSRGALVIGPPGTGKSLVAKAAGSILNLPVIRFDVGRVFNQYIGQSEHAMRGVLALIDAMSPCVLMVDEIDKGFAGMTGGGGDNGTTQRVFGTFLTWMQERNQTGRPVFLIMTANRVHGLPPELLRRGRIDEIWSVNVPNDDEREAIIQIHLNKRDQSLERGDLKAAVRITKDLVGAEIEAMIEDALVLSLGSDTPGVTYEFIDEAKATLKEMSRTRAEEFEAMQAWAAENARPASSPMLSSDDDGPKSPTVRRGRKKPRAKVTRST